VVPRAGILVVVAVLAVIEAQYQVNPLEVVHQLKHQ
jgi:hypothetical protein